MARGEDIDTSIDAALLVRRELNVELSHQARQGLFLPSSAPPRHGCLRGTQMVPHLQLGCFAGMLVGCRARFVLALRGCAWPELFMNGGIVGALRHIYLAGEVSAGPHILFSCSRMCVRFATSTSCFASLVPTPRSAMSRRRPALPN